MSEPGLQKDAVTPSQLLAVAVSAISIIRIGGSAAESRLFNLSLLVLMHGSALIWGSRAIIVPPDHASLAS